MISVQPEYLSFYCSLFKVYKDIIIMDYEENIIIKR